MYEIDVCRLVNEIGKKGRKKGEKLGLWKKKQEDVKGNQFTILLSTSFTILLQNTISLKF